MSTYHYYSINLENLGDGPLPKRAKWESDLWKQVMAEISELDKGQYVNRFGDFKGESEWRNEEEVMVEISRRYPDLVFELYNEVNDEYYLTYYHRGGHQEEEGEIVYPRFDARFLKYPEEERA